MVQGASGGCGREVKHGAGIERRGDRGVVNLLTCSKDGWIGTSDF